MNIAEVERRTGLTRANIRFYEKEGLLSPVRGANGYRDYTEDDVETLRKVRLLRQLRLSVPEIRAVQAGEHALPEAAARQLGVLEQDIREGQQAYAACRAICEDGAQWDGLDVDKYLSISVLPAYLSQTPEEQDRIPPAGCPWRRYFARSLDLSLYGLIWSMVGQWGLRINPVLYHAWVWTLACTYAGAALMLAFEPVLLHFWGTTIGKWVFGLSVRDEDGHKLSIRTAFARAWGVFCIGMGWGIPLYSLYRMWRSYRTCIEEELPWDMDNACTVVVRERQTKWYRAAGYIVLMVLAGFADVGIGLRAALPPNRGELTLAEYVENCNDYQVYRGARAYIQPDGSWARVPMDSGRGFQWEYAFDYEPEISVETDAQGFVSAVHATLRDDGNDGMMMGGNFGETREMIVYAFAASRTQSGILELLNSPLMQELEGITESFTADFHDMQVVQTVAYSGCVQGESSWTLIPTEGEQAVYRMEFTICKK